MPFAEDKWDETTPTDCGQKWEFPELLREALGSLTIPVKDTYFVKAAHASHASQAASHSTGALVKEKQKNTRRRKCLCKIIYNKNTIIFLP